MTGNVLVGSKFESHQVRGMRARIHSRKNLVQTLTLILIALHYVSICIVPLQLFRFALPLSLPLLLLDHLSHNLPVLLDILSAAGEAEAWKRKKVDKLILGFARAAGILTNMRNSQLQAAKQASKGRSSGLHQSIEEELKEQVADVPFEVLQQAQSSGQLPSFSHKKKLVDTKRANKNRPMEVTSKKPVGRLREVIQAPKKDIRDPRFESLCGNFEEARFKKAYSFLYDEELPSERQRLEKVVKKGNVGEEVEEAEHKLAWIDRQLREEEQRRKQAEQVTQFRAKEKDAVKQGKKHYYPKKSEKRKEELVRKYQELKATGKLEKFLEKRRRKNAAKDHRYLPYRRPESNQD